MNSFEEEILNGVDPGIRHEVAILRNAGVETFESCEGGEGHAFYEPTVRFHGHYGSGFKAFGIASENGLQVAELRRKYSVEDGELKGPWWELTFVPTKTSKH